jgi:hypothetical protein
MPKFGPEPQFEPRTLELNLRFRFCPAPEGRFGSRFGAPEVGWNTFEPTLFARPLDKY